MDEIKTIEDIQQLVREGFDDWKRYGEVSVRPNGDGSLLIFNYTNHALYEGKWNFFETVSRGLIIHTLSGEVIARPFDKFFNWGEGGRYSFLPIRRVAEKMDGSLGILYRHNGKYHIATRGSFDGTQAQWATRYLDEHYQLNAVTMPESWTLLFEIVYPENRVVVDYGDKAELFLLAIRDRFTGAYVNDHEVCKFASSWGFGVPQDYEFRSTDEIAQRLTQLGANEEGFVVQFSDGQRFKFKGLKYLELHRLVSTLSFKNALAVVRSNTVGDIQSQIPDEFLTEFNGWVHEIKTRVVEITEAVERLFAAAPKESRKEYALWVQAHHALLAPYLFARLDNRPIEPLIYSTAFKDR